MPFCQHCGGEVQLGWKACPQCANPIVNIPQPTIPQPTIPQPTIPQPTIPQPTIPQIPQTDSPSDILDSIDELLGPTPSIQDSVVMGNVGDTTNFHQSTAIHSSTTVNQCGSCGASGATITEYKCHSLSCENSFCNHCKESYYEHPRLCNYCAKSSYEADQRAKESREFDRRRQARLAANEIAEIKRKGTVEKWCWHIGTALWIALVVITATPEGTIASWGCLGWIIIGLIVGAFRNWWTDEYGDYDMPLSAKVALVVIGSLAAVALIIWLTKTILGEDMVMPVCGTIGFIIMCIIVLLFDDEKEEETHFFSGIITKKK